jgi:hypothetical protein
MGFTVTVEAEYLRIVLSGTLTPIDLEGLVEAVLAVEAALMPVPHRVTDMSGLTRLDIGFPEIFQLAERARTAERAEVGNRRGDARPGRLRPHVSDDE